MFTDQRSKRVLFVTHCILNQNAKIDCCAHYPGAMRELAHFLVDSGVGLIQLPCPELLALGLDRQADPTVPSTVESEDTRVATLMNHPASVDLCRRIAADVASQAEQYTRHGFSVVGCIGVNGSPTCGVETNWRDGEEAAGPGVLIGSLQQSLPTLPLRGVKALQPDHAVAVARELTR